MPARDTEIQPGPHLAAELEFYEEHFDDYATRFPDQYVLICGQGLIGVFPTRREAIDEGYRLGVRKMLVRRCGTRPEPVLMPTLLRAWCPLRRARAPRFPHHAEYCQ